MRWYEHLPYQRRWTEAEKVILIHLSVVVWASLSKDIGVNIHLLWEDKGLPEVLKEAHCRICENENWVGRFPPQPWLLDCYHLPCIWWLSTFFQCSIGRGKICNWVALRCSASITRRLSFDFYSLQEMSDCLKCNSMALVSCETYGPSRKVWPEPQLVFPDVRPTAPA